MVLSDCACGSEDAYLAEIGDRFSYDEGVSKSAIDFYDNMRLAFARLLAGMCRITFSSILSFYISYCFSQSFCSQGCSIYMHGNPN